jgi:hypothetical protein
MNIQWHDTAALHNARMGVVRALNTQLLPVTKGNDFCVPAWEAGKLSDGSTLYVCEDDANPDGYEVISMDDRGDIDQIATLSDVYDADELLRFVRSILSTR